jgi:serine/threonine-protein kinase
MERCPTAGQLERWLRQPRTGGEFEELARHVDGCPSCQQALDRLAGGATTALSPQASPEPPTADAAALNRLKDVRPTTDLPAGPLVPAPAAASGAQSRLEEETRRLLLRRLRVVCPLLALAVVAILALFLGGAMDPLYVRGTEGLSGGVVLAAMLAALASPAVVWARGGLSLRALRGVELVVFGLMAAFLAKYRYTSLTHGPAGDWEGPAHQDLFVSHVAIINNGLWHFLTISYGVFIPNTLRRCVRVVALLTVTPLAVTVLAAWQQPEVRDQLGFLLSVTALGMLFSAALAVYGSHKISTLRREAMAARQLGQYRLKGRLGAGGMGEVYLAEHRLLKRPCAVKLIRPERAGDPQNLRRFEREVQATARLKSLHTVEIYDYGHAEDGTFYYAMEYLPGLSLDELVTCYGPLPPARAVHFLRQLCDALREAHAAGLIHRDIKPGNGMACEPGGLCDVVKLLDFGLARPPDGGGAGTRLTQEGLIVGTPDFMSPEQARGEALDARSDLYSLGALAYFLLAGRPPFEGRSVLETLTAHLHQPPPELTGAPADLAAVVRRCLAKNAADRYPDAESLGRALAACACAGGWTEEQARAWWATVRAKPTAVSP